MLVDTLKWRYWNDYRDNAMNYSGWPHVYPLDGLHYMASTGLLDANGKEIWEGDILFIKAYDYYVTGKFDGLFQYKDTWYIARGEVDYRQGLELQGCKCQDGFILIEDDDDRREPCYAHNLEGMYYREAVVVGNIHENPGLLSARICCKCHILILHQGTYRMGPPIKRLACCIVCHVREEKDTPVEPTGKPKTIEAFYLPTLTGLSSKEWDDYILEFAKWMRERDIYHRTDKESRFWWADGLLSTPPCVVIKTPDPERNDTEIQMIVHPGQWVIKEGDTWRVADSLKEET